MSGSDTVDDDEPGEEAIDCSSEPGADRPGYRNPPKSTRWRKGYCPNPAGRPRKDNSRTYQLRQIAERMVEVTIAGRTRRLSTIEAIVMVVKMKAIEGNARAIGLRNRLLGITEDDAETAIPKGVLIVGEKMTPEEWDAMFGESDAVEQSRDDGP